MPNWNDKVQDAIWVANSLFARGKVSGAAANLSFVHENTVYITASGSCFGRLTAENFAAISMEGKHLEGPKPSKEFSLHQVLYQRHTEAKAVLHTHSCYATLWACTPPVKDVIPSLTPYLAMRLGEIIRVPFAHPGSEELFGVFREHIGDNRGYLLENHGPIIVAKDIITAFYDMEELEEAAKNAWFLR